MTDKERRHVRKLEIRVEELERHFKIANNSNVETFAQLFETRVALKQAFAALEECAVILHECIKNDPQFMVEKKRIEVMGDF